MFAQLNYYKRLWGLEDDGEPFSTRSAFLQPVRSNGTTTMLKIAVNDEEIRSNHLMNWWNGNGAAKVLKHHSNALLMERASGNQSLTTMARAGRDSEASQILCSVANQLHQHQPPYPAPLVPLKEWFSDLEPAAAKYGGVFFECSKIASRLLADQHDEVALHGDIHHGNVLDFGKRGWLAIDPKGLVGERGFDYANIFCNPDIAIATQPGRLMKQVKVISEAASLNPDRLLQWIAAWAGLSAVWSFIDKMDPEPAVTMAKMAVAGLGVINW